MNHDTEPGCCNGDCMRGAVCPMVRRARAAAAEAEARDQERAEREREADANRWLLSRMGAAALVAGLVVVSLKACLG